METTTHSWHLGPMLCTVWHDGDRWRGEAFDILGQAMYHEDGMEEAEIEAIHAADRAGRAGVVSLGYAVNDDE